MRHRKHGRKLSRTSAHRKALWSNMVASLIEHERIQTTDAKAKELRTIVEPVIVWSTKVADIIGKEPAKLDAEEKAAIVHAYRMARRVVKQREALQKLFHDLGPRLRGRPGGFTRVLKYRVRPGDAAPMSIIEFVDRAEEGAGATPPEAPKAKASKASAKAEKAPKAEAAAEKKAKKPSTRSKKSAAAEAEE